MSEAQALAAGMDSELRHAEECLSGTRRPGGDTAGGDTAGGDTAGGDTAGGDNGWVRWGELELRLGSVVGGMERMEALAAGALEESERREAAQLLEGIGARLRRVTALLEQAGRLYGEWFGLPGAEARGVRVDRLG